MSMIKRKESDNILMCTIIKNACKHFKISHATLLSDAVRGSWLTKMVMYAIYYEANYSHENVAKLFNESRHHASMYAMQQVTTAIRYKWWEAETILKFYKRFGYCRHLWAEEQKRA